MTYVARDQIGPGDSTGGYAPRLYNGRPRRIAVVRALHIGDLLQAVPALRALRHGFPEAEITLVGLPWAGDFADRFGHYIDRFLEFPGYPGIVEAEYDAQRTERFFDEQRGYEYELAIQMHGSGINSNGFTAGLGAALTIGFHGERGENGLDFSIEYPDHLPEAARNLVLVGQLGCDTSDFRLEFPLFSEDYRQLANLLSGAERRPLIGIHAGARAPSRRWPLDRFAQLAERMLDCSGGTVVLTGGHDDVEKVRRVQSLMKRSAVNLAGRTSLSGLAALISQLDLFISNDTGPAHIARALETPSLTLFGPADPARWASSDQHRHRVVRQPVSCSPCLNWDCPIDHRCMRWISVSRVLDDALRLVERGRAECIDSRS